MRTTVSLDPDVARLLGEESHRTKKSFKETLNAAVRVAYGQKAKFENAPPFLVESRPMGLRGGIDPSRLNSLLDELDAEAFLMNSAQDSSEESQP